MLRDQQAGGSGEVVGGRRMGMETLGRGGMTCRDPVRPSKQVLGARQGAECSQNLGHRCAVPRAAGVPARGGACHEQNPRCWVLNTYHLVGDTTTSGAKSIDGILERSWKMCAT